MNTKERIISLRLIEKLNKNPALAKRLINKARVKRIKKSNESEQGKIMQL